MTSVAPAAPPSKRSVLPIAGAVALAAVVVLGLWGGFGMVVWRLRHSQAGREAVRELQASPQLQSLLGTPIRAHIDDGDLARGGRASFSMQLTGPRGKLHAALHSTKVKGRWQIHDGVLSLADGREVALELPPPGVPNPAVP